MAFPRRRRKHAALTHKESSNAALEDAIDVLLGDTTAASMYEMPWRSGLNAARAVHHLVDMSASRETSPAHQRIALHMMTVLMHDQRKVLYDEAREMMSMELVTTSPIRDRVYCFSRLVQLHASNSHGGGNAYNEVLRLLDARLDPESVDHLRYGMMLARCRDAIGTHYHLANDSFDRVRSAFATLWRHRHYRAIYALPFLMPAHNLTC